MVNKKSQSNRESVEQRRKEALERIKQDEARRKKTLSK